MELHHLWTQVAGMFPVPLYLLAVKVKVGAAMALRLHSITQTC